MRETKRIEAEIVKLQSEIRDRRLLGQPTSACFKELRQLKKELRAARTKDDRRRA